MACSFRCPPSGLLTKHVKEGLGWATKVPFCYNKVYIPLNDPEAAQALGLTWQEVLAQNCAAQPEDVLPCSSTPCPWSSIFIFLFS